MLQCAKLSLPIRYFTGRDLFYLHFDAWDWGPPIYVGPQPRIQFVTGFPYFPKIKAKGVVLVKGPWYETLGSPRLPFDLN